MPAPRTFLRSLASATAVAAPDPRRAARGRAARPRRSVRPTTSRPTCATPARWCCPGRRSGRRSPTRCRSTTRPPSRRPSSRPGPEHQGRRDSTLVPGKNFWRIRAIGNGKTSGWANGTLHRAARSPRRSRWRPRTARSSPQPQSPPLLQWSSSQGAVSYTIEVDGDSDLLGAKVYTDPHDVVRRHRPADDRRLVLAGDGQQGRRPDQPPVGRVALRHPGPAGPADHLPAERRQPDDRGRRPRLDAGARRAQLRRAGGARRRLQQHHLQLHQRRPASRYSPADDSGQRPVLVACPRRRPGRPADAVDRVAQRLPAPVARPAPAGLPDRAHSSAPTSRPTLHPVDARAARVLLRALRRHQRQHHAGPTGCCEASARRTCPRVTGDCGIVSGRQPVLGGPADQTSPTPARPPGHLLGARSLQVDRHRRRWAAPSTSTPWSPDLKVVGRRQRHRQRRQRAAGPGATRHATSATGVPTTPVFSWDPVPGADVLPPRRRPGRELHHQPR